MGKVKIDVGLRVCYKACKGMGMSEGECLEHTYGYLTRVLDYS